MWFAYVCLLKIALPGVNNTRFLRQAHRYIVPTLAVTEAHIGSDSLVLGHGVERQENFRRSGFARALKRVSRSRADRVISIFPNGGFHPLAWGTLFHFFTVPGQLHPRTRTFQVRWF